MTLDLEIVPALGFSTTMTRIDDIGPRKIIANVVCDCHRSNSITSDHEKVPVIGFSTATVPNR